MIKQKGLPHNFRGETVAVVAYVLNRSPTKRLRNSVLEIVWSGKRPTLEHLRVFGSLCFKHVPNERRKLDDKSKPMILIRYHETRAYMLYDPAKKKICINRDVVVNEVEQ